METRGARQVNSSVRGMPGQLSGGCQRLSRRALPGIKVRTVTATAAARAGVSVLSFSAGVLAARTLGPHGRGLLAVLMAVPGVIGILGLLGHDTANLRFTGLSHSAFRQAVRRSVAFSVVVGTAAAAAWWLSGWLWPAARLGLSPGMAWLGAAMCPATLLLTLLGTAEIGRGRTSVYNCAMTGTMAVYLAGVCALRLSGHLTVISCFTAYAASQLCGIAALLALGAKRLHPDGQTVALRRYSGYALRAYLPNIIQYGMLRMDVPIIQVLAGTAAVAMYAVALPFAEALLLLPVTVGLVMFPRVTSGSVGKHATVRIGLTVLAATTMLAAAVALAVPVAVPALYGSAFHGSVAVIWAMLPGLTIFSVARTVQTYLTGTDDLKPVIIAAAAGAATGLVSLFALTGKLGAVGAGAADSAAYVAFSAVMLVRLGVPGAIAARMRRFRQQAAGRARDLAAQLPVTGIMLGSATAMAALLIGELSTGTAVTAGLAAGLILVLTVLAMPSSGLYILAAAIPVSQTSVGNRWITDRDLLVLIVVCLLGMAAARRITLPRPWAVALAVSAVCYFLVSATLVGGGISGQDLRGLLTLGAVLLILPVIAGPGSETRRAAVVFALSAAFVALLEVPTARSSLADQGSASAVNGAAAAAGQTGALNHNTEGALFVVALAVLLTCLPRARDWLTRVTLLAATAALLTGVAYSFSRSAYLGALAVLALFAVRRTLRGLLAAVVAAGCLLPLAPGAVLARAGTIWAGGSLDFSSATRLDLWGSAFRMFVREPVLGVGYLHFGSVLPAYYQNSGPDDTTILNISGFSYAHNTFLTILSQTGLAGAGLIGALALIGWRHAWAGMRQGDWASEGAILAFTGTAVCSVFGEPLFETAFLAAFLLVISACHKERSPELGPDDARNTARSSSPGETGPAIAASSHRGHGDGGRVVLPADGRPDAAGPLRADCTARRRPLG
jgi:O-antigen ligase/O-antigen/teichoic acid export membrane protein